MAIHGGDQRRRSGNDTAESAPVETAAAPSASGGGGAAEQGRGARSGPTPQGPNAAGPGDEHGTPPDDAPGPWGTGERPFHPGGGKPAHDPDGAAEAVLARARSGPRAAGGAGPEAAGSAGEKSGG